MSPCPNRRTLKVATCLLALTLAVLMFSRSFLRRQPYDTRPVSFNVTQERDYFQEYLTAIQNSNSTKCDSSIAVADAHKKEYFDVIGQNHCVRTVQLKVPVDKLSDLLVDKYYTYASNDCRELEKRSIYGQNYSVLHYGTTCSSSAADLAQGFPLKHTALGVGLPDDYPAVVDKHDQTTLTYLHVIHQGIAFADGDVLANRTRIVPQKCNRNVKSKTPSVNKKTLARFSDVLSISQYWGSGFYHGTVEELPRLAAYLPFLEKHPQVKLHCSKHHRFMDALGVPKSRVVTGTVQAERLYVPAGTTCGRPPLFTTQLLSRTLRSKLSLNGAKRDLVVLIKRTAKRFFLQHKEILAMLERHARRVNLTVAVYPDDPVPTVGDTATVFSRAVIVVAPHGAGESNLVLSAPGTVVLEGMCDIDGTRTNLCYRNLAQALGMRFFGVVYAKGCKKITAGDLEKPYRTFLDMYKTGVLG